MYHNWCVIVEVTETVGHITPKGKLASERYLQSLGDRHADCTSAFPSEAQEGGGWPRNTVPCSRQCWGDVFASLVSSLHKVSQSKTACEMQNIP